MKLEIISPEEILFSGEVVLVTLPGVSGGFSILPGHAPIISALEQGKLLYREPNNEDVELKIAGGFVEMKNNVVTVCIDGLAADIWKKTDEFWVHQ